MIDLKNRVEQFNALIFNAYEKKMIWQFRDGRQKKKIKSSVRELIKFEMEKVSSEIRKEYEFWIPTPDGTLKNRIYFLIFGKF